MNVSVSPPVVEQSHNDKELWDLHDLLGSSDPYDIAYILYGYGFTADDLAGYPSKEPVYVDICQDCGNPDHPDQTCMELYNG